MLQSQVLVAVLLNHDSEPYAFKLENQHFLVCSKPVRWYSRKTWWSQADAAPPGAGRALLEVEMWRLWATSEQTRGFFELRHELGSNQWQLVQIDAK